MITLMSKLAVSILMSAVTLANPANLTPPKPLSFGASSFVTIDNHIRVSVSKTVEIPVQIVLRNADREVVFSRNISKKEANYALKLNVNELADGTYELEVKSEEGSIRKQLSLSTQPVQQTSRVVAML